MNRLPIPAPLLASAVAALFAFAPAAHAGDADADALQQRLARAETLAGLTPVEGPGVIVTLRHSPKQAPRGVDRKALMIRDQDVNAVLNALRVGGAEALAVGDAQSMERVLVSTAARESADGILVNGTLLRPPYRLLALGNTAGLRGELYRPGGVIKSAALDALQMAEVVSDDRLVIPAARQAPELRYARQSNDSGTGGGGADSPPRVEMPTRIAVAPRVIPPVVPPVVPPRVDGTPKSVQGVVRRTPGGSAANTAIERTKPAPVKSANSDPPKVRQADPPVEPVKTVVASGDGSVFGGKDLGKFHSPGCRFGERIAAGERVFYKTADEAKRAGRNPCPFCQSAAAKPQANGNLR